MTVTHADRGEPFHNPHYRVGSLPLDPFVVQLVDTDGRPRSLQKYDRVELHTEGLPAGTTSVYDAQQGIITHTWTERFTEAGVFMVQARLHSGERVDFAPPIAVVVEQP